MLEKFHPDNVEIAIEHISDHMPSLVGADWQQISPTFLGISSELKQENTLARRIDLVLQLMALIKPYQQAVALLEEQISAVSQSREIVLKGLQPFASKYQLSEEDLNFCVSRVLPLLPAEVETDESARHIRVKPYGIGGVTSVKLSNVDMSIFTLGGLTSTIATTTLTAIEKFSPLVVALGILTTILSVAQSSTVKIEEQEGSVLWGLVLARDEESSSDTNRILLFVNRSRVIIGLKKLEKEDVVGSLNKLKLLKVVKKLPGALEKWQLIESFEIINTG